MARWIPLSRLTLLELQARDLSELLAEALVPYPIDDGAWLYKPLLKGKRHSLEIMRALIQAEWASEVGRYPDV